MASETLLFASAIVTGIVALLLLASLLRWRKRLGWLRGLLAWLLIFTSIGLGAVGLGASRNNAQAKANEPTPLSAQTLIYTVSQPSFGSSSNITVIRAFEGRQGHFRWSRNVPGHIVTTTAQHQQTLYVIAMTYNPTEETITALDAQSGIILWQQTVPHVYKVTALITKNAVYLLTSGNGASNIPTVMLLAFSAATGQPLWNYSWVIDPWRMTEQVAANDNFVFLANPLGGDQGVGSQVAAYRASDGRQVWLAQLGSTPIGRLYAGTNEMYVIFTPGTITGLRATDGKHLWDWDTYDTYYADSQNVFAIVPSGDSLYISAKHTLVSSENTYALDGRSGTVIWTVSVAAVKLNLVGSSLYIFANDGLHAVRTSDGKVLWHVGLQVRYGMQGIEGNNIASILQPPSDQVVFISAYETFTKDTICFICVEYWQDYLYALNVQTGLPYWRIEVGSAYQVQQHEWW